MGPGPFNAAKFIGCWVCIVIAVVLLAVEPRGLPYVPGTFALLAIAFAQAPVAYR